MDTGFRSRMSGAWSLISWKHACCGLITLAIAQFLIISQGFGQPNVCITTSQSPSTRPEDHSIAALDAAHFVETSLGNVTGDGLTAEQCLGIFPDLYHPIDKAIEHWKTRRHVISREDIDVTYRVTSLPVPERGAAMRILIHDNELRVLESLDPTCNFQSIRERAVGTLFNIQAALQSATAGGETLPTIEAALVFLDQTHYPDEPSTRSTWAMAANTGDQTHQRHWLMPSFDFRYSFESGPYYSDARRRAMEHDVPWTSKIPKAVWRGSRSSDTKIRATLLQVTKDKEWADVHEISANSDDPELNLSLDELCRYVSSATVSDSTSWPLTDHDLFYSKAFTIHTEGATYSGRLKFLLNCNSVPIVHDYTWISEWYHLLKDDGPEQNHVRVKRDWSDLEQKVQYYLDHPDEAQRIIDSHLATFRGRYLTKAAQSCYIRALIQGYSTVSFKPVVYIQANAEPGKASIRRGEPFEQFIYEPRDFVEGQLG
ncbi:DUF821 domain-containing protein [Teratosphaeria destructans]|uniref:DUF821 domain-containing protein n=1 Tax=Teratosphaeria destructans TaxID=418781 RepID=A0A9W7W4C8_9PEZI|nr:DUF821 domain-containing protein [Teratosphaeria destructans]